MGLKSVIKDIVRGILYLIPKSKYKLLIESVPDYADNSRAFSDYLIENDKYHKLRIVWCVRDPKKFTDLHKSNPCLRFTSFIDKKYILSYMWAAATAKTVLFTHAVPPFSDTRAQTVGCLWHGTPLKLMEHTPTKYPCFSFILSASEFCSKSLAECFKVPGEQVKILGYPRCDLLFSHKDELSKLNIKKDNYSSVLLWMPTFRQSSQLNIFDTEQTGTGLPLIETHELLSELNEKLKLENLLLIIKLHPLQDTSDMQAESFSNIFMLTSVMLEEKGIELYPLVSCCDVLLTDYSSIYFDYLLLNRPIGFIIDDIEQYEKNRGFVTDTPLDLMPGSKIRTKADLFAFFDEIKSDFDSYSPERQHVNCIVNFHQDNLSSQRLSSFLGIDLS